MPSRYAYVGCFTSERRRARGKGIDVYRVDDDSGAWTHLQHLGGLDNPSFLLLNKAGTRLYAVHADLTYASAYAVDPATGKITALGRADTGGENGVAHALDRSERYLIVANYTGGNVAVLPVGKDGALGDHVQSIPLPGQPRPMHRAGHHQNGSHPHDVMWDSTRRWVIIPDKGLDRISVFAWDARAHRLRAATPDHAQARDGAGPRHIAFHPRKPVAWILNEADSTITTAQWDAEQGTLAPYDVVSTLPGTFTGDTSTAEIAYHPGVGMLYASNRGHDTITVLKVSRSNATPRPVAWVPTLGEGPRFFRIDPTGRWLYAANEVSDTIVRFSIDPQTGALHQAGEPIVSPSPSTIVFSR